MELVQSIGVARMSCDLLRGMIVCKDDTAAQTLFLLKHRLFQALANAIAHLGRVVGPTTEHVLQQQAVVLVHLQAGRGSSVSGSEHGS